MSLLSGQLPLIMVALVAAVGVVVTLVLWKPARKVRLIVGSLGALVAVALPTLVALSTIVVPWAFHVLHISVDEDTLSAGFRGPFQERIPLSWVVRCTTATYDLQDYGVGEHLGPAGKMYNVTGDGGIATKVTLADGQNILFSSSDSQAVCDALHERNPEIAEV